MSPLRGILLGFGVLCACVRAHGEGPSPPVILFPAQDQVFPSSTTVVRVSWAPSEGAYAYSPRVADKHQQDARDPRDDCRPIPVYVCVGPWGKTSIDIAVRRGHSYSFWVHGLAPGLRYSAARGVAFSVAGPPRRTPPNEGFGSPWEDMRQQMEQAEAYLAALARLQSAYETSPRLAIVDRAHIRDNIQACRRRGEVLREALKKLSITRLVSPFLLPIGQAMDEVPTTADLNEEEERLHAYGRVSNEVWEAKLSEDERLWLAAQARGARRRRLALFAALGFLTAAATAAFRRRRRRTPAGPPLLNGSYRLGGELGRGGMGVVYEAFDVNLKRAVAIKRPSPEVFEASPGGFLQEAQLVAALRHPNIVQIYDVFEEGGRVYLVFERVSGRTLRPPMALERAKGVLAQICAALDYAHARKVIHRDLKPSNIMLGDDGIVKVMDFGLARQARHTVTRTQGWGTPAYMAPEQELGVVSRESDLYALGVCLYELATGRLPFAGPDFLAQKQRMDYAREGLPEGLRPVLAKALAAEPALRYHSGAELLAELERA